MYTALYQYLIQHKELPVPGIGTFLLEKKSASIDFPGKRINPPSYSISMQAGSYLPDKEFFSWLASANGITDRKAVLRFNDFTFNIKKKIGEGATISWNSIGILNADNKGHIKFTPSSSVIILEKPIDAEKVIREKAEHMVRVGEDERTAEEMTEMLRQEEEKKSYWWVYALALSLLAIMFIGWYFSEHGVDTSATANTQKSVPMAPAATYTAVP